MKSLKEFLLEAYERPNIFTALVHMSFYQSSGLGIGGKAYGRSKQNPDTSPQIMNALENVGGCPVLPGNYKEAYNSDDINKALKAEHDYDIDDNFYRRLKPLFQIGLDPDTQSNKKQSAYLLDKMSKLHNLDNWSSSPETDIRYPCLVDDSDYTKEKWKKWIYSRFFLVNAEMVDNIEKGLVAYWNVKDYTGSGGGTNFAKVSGDPGGAAYSNNEINNARIFAFEYYDDSDWFKRGAEFEYVAARYVDDKSLEKSHTFVCRWFKTMEGAEFWKNWVEGFKYKADHKVCIIDFDNPSPEAKKFLSTHKRIFSHKSPGIYGGPKNYGVRSGILSVTLSGMDRFMDLVREYKGQKPKKHWDRYHDNERETVWKNDDPKTKQVEKVNPEPQKKRECSHPSSKISNEKMIMYKGHEIRTYVEKCVDCGAITYGLEVDHKECLEGGYATRAEALERAKKVVQDMNNGNW